MKKPTGQAALGFIFVTMLIDVIGFGIIIPVLPSLIQRLIHGSLSDAAPYAGFLLTAYSLMQFLFSPLIGNLSDKYGRRPILLFSLLGFGIDYLFLAIAPSMGWLFVGRVIAGITGASFTTASAYIADVSTPEKRAANFGLIGVAFGVGFILGPILGGFLGEYGVKLPFYAAAGLALINVIYGYFILPESLSLENRRQLDFKRCNPIGTLKQLSKYKAVFGLVFALFLISFASQSVQSTWAYYTMEKFGWGKRMEGYSLGAVGLMVGVVQGLLIRMIIPKFGQKKSIILGLLFYTIGLTLFAFANNSWLMFAFIIPYSLGGIAGPALQGYMSNGVPDNEQGELQGGLTSLFSLSAILGPLLMTSTFHYFTKKGAVIYFPGAPFIIGAILMLLSAVLTLRSFKRIKQ